MSLTSNTVLSFRMFSSANRFLSMPIAVSTGTEVNKAVRSKELRYSPGNNVTLLACSFHILSAIDVVSGPNNQQFKYFGKYLSHSISD